MRYVIGSFRERYGALVNDIYEQGAVVAPRGQKTYEVLDWVLEFTNPANTVLNGIGRDLNTRLMVVEQLQLLGGICATDLLREVAPNIGQFSEGGHFAGAYGPRIRAQLPRVVERLKADPDTRQAVMTIWDPAQDLYYEGGVDYPCTVMLQFLIRDDKLLMHVTMRSNDVFWGLSYDAPTFAFLQLNVANTLGLEVGSYFHHAVSLHLYERDLPALEKLYLPTTEPEKLMSLPVSSIEKKQQLARSLLLDERAQRGWADYDKHMDLLVGRLSS